MRKLNKFFDIRILSLMKMLQFKQINRLLFFAFFIMQFPALIYALDPTKAITQYIHKAWYVEDGLPQSSVWSITQTADGYLWFGTEEGLVRFDGTKFMVFNKLNTPLLGSNVIHRLLQDSQGNLWISTNGGGLLYYRNGEFAVYTTENGLASNVVYGLAEDQTGKLWIGTINGLNTLHHGKFETFTTADNLPSDTIYAPFIDSQNRLWVQTDKGVSRFENGKFSSSGLPAEWTGKTVRSLSEDSTGRIWLTADGVLESWQNNQLTVYGAKEGFDKVAVYAIKEDRDGNLWFGTGGALKCLRRDGRFETFGAADGLPNALIRSIWEDREGNLWFGMNGGGLHRLSEGKFFNYTAAEGLPRNAIWGSFEARDQGMWFGTDGGGAVKITNKKVLAKIVRDDLPSQTIYSILEDRNGSLWLGTEGGLSRLDNNRLTTYTTKQGLAGNIVYALYEDRRGRLWIGTVRGGLSQFFNGKLTNYTAVDGLGSSTVRAIFEDRAGNLWFGTDGGGMTKYDNEKFTVYNTQNGLRNDDIYSFHEDETGALWIGTGNGLHRFKGGEFAVVSTTNNLFDDIAYSILEDDTGNYWMTCNKGIYRISRQELNDVADGKSSRVNPVSYNFADGLPSNDCTGGVQSAARKTSDGQLWFSTLKGVAVINPNNIKVNNLPPPTVIETILIDNLPAVKQETIEIPPGKEKFEIQYTGLSFVAPEAVRFRYKLEGFDKEWIDAGTRRTAFYTNLPPGDYRFQVAASNNDGVWNEPGAAQTFRIQPSFYQTNWFLAVCALVMLLIVYGLYQVRMQQVKREFAAVLGERARVAREMHDTLIQGALGASALLSATAKAQTAAPEKVAEFLTLAREQLYKTIDEARAAVWNLRRYDPNTDFIQHLKEESLQLTAKTNIQTSFAFRGTPHPLSKETAQNLLLINQEAVTNVIKHAGDCNLIISLEYFRDLIILIIEDDGCGFERDLFDDNATDNNHHFGLLGMRERAAEISAALTVKSTKGDGTQIIIRSPLK